MSSKRTFLSFKKTREFVHTLKLQNQLEWNSYCKSGKKPNNIPRSPERTYKNKGWISWGDWLGTNNIANYNKLFLSFKKTREFVHTLKLQNQLEWNSYCKSESKPNNIPANPNRTYKDNGWISWGDWLGTKPGFDGFLSFEEARAFAHTLGLKTQKEWKVYCKSGNKPNNIPASPYTPYKNKGWLSWSDWLGTKPGFNGFFSFKEVRNIVHKLNLKSQNEWQIYCKSESKPNNIPANPNRTYKDKGWISWGDWFGTNNIATQNRTYLSFKEASAFVHTLGLKTQKEWKVYCKSGKKPDNIPNTPNVVYKNKGWISCGDWLGTKLGFDGVFLSYKEARNIVHKLNLKSQNEWQIYCKSGKKPNNIPANPDITYKNKGWLSLGDWLGTKPGFNGFLPFEEARTYIRSLGLKGQIEWLVYCKSGKKPNNIPANPDITYKNKGWLSLGDWLHISLNELKLLLQKQNIRSKSEYDKFRKSFLVHQHFSS